MKTIVVGSLNQPGRFESAQRVYGTLGVGPTIPTCQGGGIVPKIIEYEEDELLRSLQIEGQEGKDSEEGTETLYDVSAHGYRGRKGDNVGSGRGGI